MLKRLLLHWLGVNEELTELRRQLEHLKHKSADSYAQVGGYKSANIKLRRKIEQQAGEIQDLHKEVMKWGARAQEIGAAYRKLYADLLSYNTKGNDYKTPQQVEEGMIH